MSGVSVARKGVCLVAGAGPGIGQSVANRFAKEGKTLKMSLSRLIRVSLESL